MGLTRKVESFPLPKMRNSNLYYRESRLEHGELCCWNTLEITEFTRKQKAGMSYRKTKFSCPSHTQRAVTPSPNVISNVSRPPFLQLVLQIWKSISHDLILWFSLMIETISCFLTIWRLQNWLNKENGSSRLDTPHPWSEGETYQCNEK